MDEPVERSPRLLELSRTQCLKRAIEICPCLLRRLGGYAPHFLELSNSAVRFAAPRKYIYELQSNGEIRRCDREHVPQPVFVPPRRSAVRLPGFQLGECVQHVSVASTVAAEPRERRACIRGTASKRIEPCERETHLATRGVQLAGAAKSFLCVRVATGLQVCESKARVAEGILWRELGELL